MKDYSMTQKSYKNLASKAKPLPLFQWAEREAIRTLPPFARHIAKVTGVKPSTARLYAELAAPEREN
jgi:hypothetical protein